MPATVRNLPGGQVHQEVNKVSKAPKKTIITSLEEVHSTYGNDFFYSKGEKSKQVEKSLSEFSREISDSDIIGNIKNFQFTNFWNSFRLPTRKEDLANAALHYINASTAPSGHLRSIQYDNVMSTDTALYNPEHSVTLYPPNVVYEGFVPDLTNGTEIYSQDISALFDNALPQIDTSEANKRIRRETTEITFSPDELLKKQNENLLDIFIQREPESLETTIVLKDHDLANKVVGGILSDEANLEIFARALIQPLGLYGTNLDEDISNIQAIAIIGEWLSKIIYGSPFDRKVFDILKEMQGRDNHLYWLGNFKNKIFRSLNVVGKDRKYLYSTETRKWFQRNIINTLLPGLFFQAPNTFEDLQYQQLDVTSHEFGLLNAGLAWLNHQSENTDGKSIEEIFENGIALVQFLKQLNDNAAMSALMLYPAYIFHAPKANSFEDVKTNIEELLAEYINYIESIYSHNPYYQFTEAFSQWKNRHDLFKEHPDAPDKDLLFEEQNKKIAAHYESIINIALEQALGNKDNVRIHNTIGTSKVILVRPFYEEKLVKSIAAKIIKPRRYGLDNSGLLIKCVSQGEEKYLALSKWEDPLEFQFNEIPFTPESVIRYFPEEVQARSNEILSDFKLYSGEKPERVMKSAKDKMDVFIKNLANYQANQFFETLQHMGYEETAGEKAKRIALSFVPFFDCIDGVKKNGVYDDMETQSACFGDIMGAIPTFAGRAILTGRTLSRSLQQIQQALFYGYSKWSAKKIVSLLSDNVVQQSIKHLQRESMRELKEGGIDLLRAYDPFFELSYKGYGLAKKQIVNSIVNKKLKPDDIPHIVKASDVTDSSILPHSARSYYCPIKQRAITAVKTGKDSYFQVSPFTGEPFGPRFKLINEELIPFSLPSTINMQLKDIMAHGMAGKGAIEAGKVFAQQDNANGQGTFTSFYNAVQWHRKVKQLRETREGTIDFQTEYDNFLTENNLRKLPIDRLVHVITGDLSGFAQYRLAVSAMQIIPWPAWNEIVPIKKEIEAIKNGLDGHDKDITEELQLSPAIKERLSEIARKYDVDEYFVTEMLTDENLNELYEMLKSYFKYAEYEDFVAALSEWRKSKDYGNIVRQGLFFKERLGETVPSLVRYFYAKEGILTPLGEQVLGINEHHRSGLQPEVQPEVTLPSYKKNFLDEEAKRELLRISDTYRKNGREINFTDVSQRLHITEDFARELIHNNGELTLLGNQYKLSLSDQILDDKQIKLLIEFNSFYKKTKLLVDFTYVANALGVDETAARKLIDPYGELTVEGERLRQLFVLRESSGVAESKTSPKIRVLLDDDKILYLGAYSDKAYHSGIAVDYAAISNKLDIPIEDIRLLITESGELTDDARAAWNKAWDKKVKLQTKPALTEQQIQILNDYSRYHQHSQTAVDYTSLASKLGLQEEYLRTLITANGKLIGSEHWPKPEMSHLQPSGSSHLSPVNDPKLDQEQRRLLYYYSKLYQEKNIRVDYVSVAHALGVSTNFVKVLMLNDGSLTVKGQELMEKLDVDSQVQAGKRKFEFTGSTDAPKVPKLPSELSVKEGEHLKSIKSKTKIQASDEMTPAQVLSLKDMFAPEQLVLINNYPVVQDPLQPTKSLTHYYITDPKSLRIKFSRLNPMFEGKSNKVINAIKKSIRGELRDYFSEKKHADFFDEMLKVVTPENGQLDRGVSVIAKRDIPQFTVVGAYSGTLLTASYPADKQSDLLFYRFKSYGETRVLEHMGAACSLDYEINGFATGNIMKFITPGQKPEDNNIAAIVINERIVAYVTSREIKSGEKLFADYGPSYNPVKDAIVIILD